MRVDVNLANDHARMLRNLAQDLVSMRERLFRFNEDLRHHWRGQEVESLISVSNDNAIRLKKMVNEVDSIAMDIPLAAQEIRRQEDLADARAVLSREDNNVANMRRALDNAQRQHNINPSPATQAELNRARNNLNNAIHTRNNASARVQSLTR